MPLTPEQKLKACEVVALLLQLRPSLAATELQIVDHCLSILDSLILQA